MAATGSELNRCEREAAERITAALGGTGSDPAVALLVVAALDAVFGTDGVAFSLDSRAPGLTQTAARMPTSGSATWSPCCRPWAARALAVAAPSQALDNRL